MFSPQTVDLKKCLVIETCYQQGTLRIFTTKVLACVQQRGLSTPTLFWCYGQNILQDNASSHHSHSQHI